MVPENGVTWTKEKENDIPPPYTGDEATDYYGEVRAAIERSIADLDEELWALNREIHGKYIIIYHCLRLLKQIYFRIYQIIQSLGIKNCM